MATFRVRVFGHLPCSALMTVEAASAGAAEEYAMEHFADAPWDGADYSTPDGSQIESACAEVA